MILYVMLPHTYTSISIIERVNYWSVTIGALLCYFKRISAPVIYTLSSPSAKCVKLKGAR